VVVDDFDLMRMSISPGKTNPPLIIDAKRMLALPVLRQRLEPIAGRHSKIIECPRVIDKSELS
jgi:hypothetical protein